MRRDTFLKSMLALAAAGTLPLTAQAAANIKMHLRLKFRKYFKCPDVLVKILAATTLNIMVAQIQVRVIVTE